MDDARYRHIRLATERGRRGTARRRKKRDYYRTAQAGGGAARSYYQSKILDQFGFKYIPFKKRFKLPPQEFSFPTKFSLTNNADKSLTSIEDIVRYARTARRPRLLLNHRKVKEVGLGADAMLAAVLKEISLEAQLVPGAYIRGYKPENADARRMMDDVGSVRVLGSGVDEDINVSLKSTKTVFRHHNRGKDLKVDALTADPISQTTRDFADHLDDCLGLIGKRLSAKGKSDLLGYVAEVLINAQEHSSTAQWIIVGFIDDEDKKLIYRAAIFSFGKTIADSFNDLEKDSYAWQRVEPYISIHQKAGLFNKKWNPENLLNVVALQGNISSKLDGPASDRGQGTVDLIEFFQQMSVACAGYTASPKMSILSGRTQIVFDGKYTMKYEPSQARMIIAFNESNSLIEPPDGDVVQTLEHGAFPGVMISIAVPLANTSVEEIPQEKQHD